MLSRNKIYWTYTAISTNKIVVLTEKNFYKNVLRIYLYLCVNYALCAQTKNEILLEIDANMKSFRKKAFYLHLFRFI